MILSKTQHFFNRIHELTEFCRRNRGKCFNGWPDETLFFYVAFHALCGNLFVVRDNDKVEAIMFAQPMPVEQVKKPFSWSATTGPAVMVWELIGDRSQMPSLYRRFVKKFPEVTRFFCYRHKNSVPKLFEIPRGTVERFCHV